MRSICLLAVQVAAKGEGWMVLAIDNIHTYIHTLLARPHGAFHYDYGIFERKGCVQRDLDLNCVS